MYIKEILMDNCQCMASVPLKLTPGLNVLIAPNNTGKSVFFKMLKHACGTDLFKIKDYKHIIRYGADCAVALFELSDGSVGGVRITKGARDFLYKDVGETSMSVYKSPHPDFLYKMNIIMDEETKFILNILDSDQELMFVNSQVSTNFTLLKLIGSNDTLESVVNNIEYSLEQIAGYLMVANERRSRIVRELSKFDRINLQETKLAIEVGDNLLPVARHVLEIQEHLSYIEPVNDSNLEELERLVDTILLLTDIDNSLKSMGGIPDIDLEFLDALVDLLISLGDISQALRSIKPVSKDIFHMVDLLEVLFSFSEELGKIEHLPKLDLDHLEEIVDCVAMCFTVSENLKALSTNRSQFQEIDSELSKIELSISEMSVIVDCPVKGRVYYADDVDCLPVGK